jgi:hypothetical protein
MTATGTAITAYPTAGDVMKRARAIVNDAYRGGKGVILTDIAPFTVEFLNSALEELQDRLGNSAGEIILTWDNIILTPITPVAINPATQIFVGYDGFFNGTVMVPKPVIPSNVISIKKVWERVTGSNLPFKEMSPVMENLPSINQSNYLQYWEYRQDRLYLTGSTTTEDLRIRGEIRQLDISANDAASLADVQISILASINAMASIVAWHYADARGAMAADKMAAKKEYFIKQIRRRYSRSAQGINYARKPFGDTDYRSVRLPW